MLNLGTFTKNRAGKIEGTLYGVNMIPTKLVFEPATSAKGNPYSKVFAETGDAVVEAGAAWPKVARNERARPYLDVRLNSPGLADPFYGKLIESDVVPGQYHLYWNEPRTAKADAKAEGAGVENYSTVRASAFPAPQP